MANPKCPYCGWEEGEWADGKIDRNEKKECPNCLKKYFCRTYPSSSFGREWMHIETRLGRKPKNKYL